MDQDQAKLEVSPILEAERIVLAGLDALKQASANGYASRELSLAITNIEQGTLWLRLVPTDKPEQPTPRRGS